MLQKLKAYQSILGGKANSVQPQALPTPKRSQKVDFAVGAAFVGAISLLLLIAGYVINRISSDYANQQKWKDYNDCGWA